MKPNFHIILYIAVAVLGTILLMNIFGKSGANEKIIRAEVKAEYIEKQRISDSLSKAKEIEALQLVIETLKQKDTVYSTQIIKSNDKLKNVPAAVNSLSIEELLRAVHDY